MPKLSGANAKAAKQATGTNPFAPLPPGIHRVKLTSVKAGTSQKTNKPMWTWEFKSVEPVEGKDLREYTVIQENTMWKIGDIFEAFGVPTSTGTDDLLGKTVLVQTDVEVQQEGKGKGRERHVIVGYPDQNLEPKLYDANEVLPDDAEVDDSEPDF